MRGVARSSAAITIVNALPTGVGCAIGIARFVTVEATVEESTRPSLQCVPPESATPLVAECVRATQERVGTGGRFSTLLRVASDIPVGKGLKSSSAVASATVAAVARAHSADLEPLEVARLAAKVGREVGVSATGAFDDALAGVRPGFVTTDNRSDTVLREDPVDPSWSAVVFVPAGTHAPAPDLRPAFSDAGAEGERAALAARAGRYSEAMRRNGELVERALGYAYGPWREAVERAGAIAAGVSGLGPAFAVIVPHDRQLAVLDALPGGPGERFVAEFTGEGAL